MRDILVDTSDVCKGGSSQRSAASTKLVGYDRPHSPGLPPPRGALPGVAGPYLSRGRVPSGTSKGDEEACLLWECYECCRDTATTATHGMRPPSKSATPRLSRPSAKPSGSS